MVWNETEANYGGLWAIDSNAELRDTLTEIREFQIRYRSIITKYPEDSDRDVRCYNWTVNQRFYHTDQPMILVELDFSPDSCGA